MRPIQILREANRKLAKVREFIDNSGSYFLRSPLTDEEQKASRILEYYMNELYRWGIRTRDDLAAEVAEEESEEEDYEGTTRIRRRR